MSGVSPARRVAYEVVRRVFEEDAYADRAFRSVARELDARDSRRIPGDISRDQRQGRFDLCRAPSSGLKHH